MTAPWADSESDVTAVRMDGGVAVIDPIAGHVELSITLGARVVAAISLSSAEAREIGQALINNAGGAR